MNAFTIPEHSIFHVERTHKPRPPRKPAERTDAQRECERRYNKSAKGLARSAKRKEKV